MTHAHNLHSSERTLRPSSGVVAAAAGELVLAHDAFVRLRRASNAVEELPRLRRQQPHDLEVIERPAQVRGRNQADPLADAILVDLHAQHISPAATALQVFEWKYILRMA